MYEAGVHSSPEPTRPRQVTTLIVLLLVFGGLGILAAFLLMSSISDSPAYVLPYILIAAQFALSAMLAICGVYNGQGRAWARVLAIVLCSINIVGALASLATGAIVQAFIGFAVNIALIRLLNGHDVRVWCTR